MSNFDYPELRRVVYGGEDVGATFVPVCPHCGRFVKADKNIGVNSLGECDETKSNATCSKCGRIAMPFEGYV